MKLLTGEKLRQTDKLRLILSATLVSFFFLLETLLGKAFMLKQAGSFSDLIGVFQVSRSELVFIASSLFLGGLLLLARRKIWLLSYLIIYLTFLVIASLALFIHAGLFIQTGAGFCREYMSNFLKNAAEVTRMIVAEARPIYLFGLIFNILFFLLISRFPFSKLARALAAKARKVGFFRDLEKALLGAIIIFLIFVEAMALLSPEELVSQPVRQFPVLEIIKGLLPEETEEHLVELNPEERLDGEIEIEPGPDFKRLNVVLIIFESLSWKYCDVYHPGRGTTPFLQKLAEQSAVVERLYSIDPHTSKALIPIIAGIYPYPEPDVFEAIPGVLPEKALPHLLKKFGYRTAFFQTANNYEERPAVVANLGYEDFFGLFHLPENGFDDVNYFGKEEMMMLEPSFDWIEAQPDTPFFLTYLTLSSHHQYGVPKNFPRRDFAPENETLNRYLNAVRYIDYFIEQVFEGFKKRNLIDKTIFIIVGDHGEAFGEHGLNGHNYTLWEEGLRVPGIIYAPLLIKKNEKINGFRSLLDIVPTVCDLLGLEVKAGKFVGQSLLKPIPDDRELFYFGWSKTRVMAARRGKLKYIFRPERPFPEVYDNLEDEYDLHDLFQACESNNELRDFGYQLKQKVMRLAAVVEAQYREWKQKAALMNYQQRPESFANNVKAAFGGLISIYGYGIFPTSTQPGRTIWIRVGIRVKKAIGRPLRITVSFKHEDGIYTETAVFKPKIKLEKLKPGEFTSAESIFSFPLEAKPGKILVSLGILDEKPGVYLPVELGVEVANSVLESDLVPLTTITLMPGSDNK